jgi:glycosyltransferase domain-containing protein
MALPRSRYTLLVPTFNRSAHLRNLLGYLAARRFEYPVRVLDSSSGDALSQNRETTGRVGLDIAHEVYDAAIPMHKKIELGVATVASTYCSLCADDDVLFTDQLSGLLDVLDTDPTLVVAHGYYVNVRPGADFDLWHTDYSARSIVADDALKRIVQQMTNYQAIFYGVHRTHVMKSIRVPLDRVNSLWAKELLTSSLALIAGGAYRVPQYYMARNTNPSISGEGWHPHQFFATKPEELLREYGDYRAVLLEQLGADARCRATYQSEQVQRVFDLVHLKYLAPMLSPDVLNYLIEESLRSDRTSRQIIDGMWKAIGAPVDGGPGRLRHTLARARRLLHPGSAAANVGYLRRLARVYGELRWREKLDVSLAPLSGGLAVQRTAREGQSRRYAISRAFLTQDFADGGQVTAPHLRNIIGHLDDYIRS